MPASEQFLAAAQLKPDSVEAWNELASALINSENYLQGLAALDRVKALGKETPGDLFFRAISLDKLRQLKPALAAYQAFWRQTGVLIRTRNFKRASERVSSMWSCRKSDPNILGCPPHAAGESGATGAFGAGESG